MSNLIRGICLIHEVFRQVEDQIARARMFSRKTAVEGSGVYSEATREAEMAVHHCG
jgi:hypothetical protein